MDTILLLAILVYAVASTGGYLTKDNAGPLDSWHQSCCKEISTGRKWISGVSV